MNKPSLRDMKKEETWHILARTSFLLALEKGLDGFTIEDVVQRAHYSRRTFANHFSCKEEAVAMAVISEVSALAGQAGGTDREEALREVDATPSDSPVEALHHWMRLRFTTNLLRELRQIFELAGAYPTLEPYVQNVLHRLQAAAQIELARICGDRYPKGYTNILAGAVFGAVLSILEGEVQVRFPGEAEQDRGEGMTFDAFLDMTFGYLKNGF